MATRTRLGVVAIPLIALSLYTSANCAPLRGRVVLGEAPPARATLNPYPGQLGSMAVGETPVWSAVQDVVIHLPADSAPFRGPKKPVTLAQRNQSFEPRVLAIPVGTSVGFPNFDPVFHNVFSYSKTKKFDLGRYGKGKSKHVVFDRPGIVKVFCDVHASMSAFIYVIDTPHIARPDADGHFEIDVPEGKHTLTVWHPERGSRTYEVTVGPDGGAVDIVF